MMNKEGERFILVTLLEELNSVICDEICCVTFLDDILPISFFRTEFGVIIVALTRKDMIGIEPFRLAKHVPLTNHTGLITSLLKVFTYERSILVNRTIERSLTALMTIHSGHQTGTTGCAERVFYISATEKHSSFSKTVKVWSWSLLAQLMSIRADGLIGMVVAHDIDDIPTLSRCSIEGTTA